MTEVYMRVESSLRGGGEDLVYCKYISILESKQSKTLHRQAYAQTIIDQSIIRKFWSYFVK